MTTTNKSIDEFLFEWTGVGTLRNALMSSFVKASAPQIEHGMLFSLNLWRENGTALTICSKMHDVAKREEVGVLSFDIVATPSSDKFVIDLPNYFAEILDVKKLTVSEEGGILAESGIVLEMKGGHVLTVLAGSFPCSIAVDGLPNMKGLFQPEWPLGKYERQLFV